MSIDTIPDVRAFLDTVRADLADLDPDEQAEILDGLEADLSELVAERGPQALDDPHAYARELRAAAGLGEAGTPRGRRSVGARVNGLLDAAHGRFDAALDRLPGESRPLVAWLQPLWWVARAWLAVQLLELLTSSTYRFALVPHLRGLGWAVLAVAVVLSVQVGRGWIWPGGRRGALARVVLLTLNALALGVVLPVATGMGNDQRYWDGYQQGITEATQGVVPADVGIDRAGVYADGRWVSNIYPYDAQGRPLSGVQLFDQAGKPIQVVAQPQCVHGQDADVVPLGEEPDCTDAETGDSLPLRVFYPWTNGATSVLNVFPLPARMQPGPERSATAFSESTRPALGPYPLATVPRVSLPGIPTGVVTPAKPAAAPAD